MPSLVDSGYVLALQKELRQRLLDPPNAITSRRGRDLAAQLLLRLDDHAGCWQFAAEWLRDTLAVERVDGGTGTPANSIYQPAQAEARSTSREVPSMHGVRINNRNPALVNLWFSRKPVVYADIAQDRQFGDDLRSNLLAVGAASKIAVALRERDSPFGLLCIDRVARPCDWRSQQYECFESVTREVLGPILWAAAESLPTPPDTDHVPDRTTAGSKIAQQFRLLTSAETRVAHLIAAGLSYKETARKLNRSVSTIDHQLRSIRRKFNVHSNSRLIRALAEIEIRHSS